MLKRTRQTFLIVPYHISLIPRKIFCIRKNSSYKNMNYNLHTWSIKSNCLWFYHIQIFLHVNVHSFKSQGIKNTVYEKWYKVCNLHFHGDHQFGFRKKIKKGSVPSLLLPKGSERNVSHKFRRFNTVKKFFFRKKWWNGKWDNEKKSRP